LRLLLFCINQFDRFVYIVGHLGKSVWTIQVNEEGTILASGGRDGCLKLWNIEEYLSIYDTRAGNSTDNDFADCLETFTIELLPCFQNHLDNLVIAQKVKNDSKNRGGQPEFVRLLHIVDWKTVLVATSKG
jgi:WD40 repeat protein